MEYFCHRLWWFVVTFLSFDVFVCCCCGNRVGLCAVAVEAVWDSVLLLCKPCGIVGCVCHPGSMCGRRWSVWWAWNPLASTVRWHAHEAYGRAGNTHTRTPTHTHTHIQRHVHLQCGSLELGVHSGKNPSAKGIGLTFRRLLVLCCHWILGPEGWVG